ncbi:hypothetical protein K470DRAFT_264142 [Piedraia hortae CBS 480.64]|uniref:ORC6 first cyclin-like domain-containing protein n=1 Tax=Piedraia hortae CBS 480.64 TaxID=1314780 RepID=A0A6A7C0N3_9PEZI|nr:hypothetical protein K470DRAFT_264142 [Piedraia hortae CBS 480.64]
MPSTIELALQSLLPTHWPLPPTLLDLCAALLAQSRTRAATLKAEEEVGRTYACCHIACERLSNRLNLEVAHPTPPVPPRVYKRLKTYLEGSLRATAVRVAGQKRQLVQVAARNPSPKRRAAASSTHKSSSVPPLATPLRRLEKHGTFVICAEDNKDDEASSGLMQGLGTMFQPAVDWLGAERRRNYAVWKEKVLREIAELEQQG